MIRAGFFETTRWASDPDVERLYSLVPGANARRAAGLPPRPQSGPVHAGMR
jgi:hypothetical protein